MESKAFRRIVNYSYVFFCAFPFCQTIKMLSYATSNFDKAVAGSPVSFGTMTTFCSSIPPELSQQPLSLYIIDTFEQYGNAV